MKIIFASVTDVQLVLAHAFTSGTAVWHGHLLGQLKELPSYEYYSVTAV